MTVHVTDEEKYGLGRPAIRIVHINVRICLPKVCSSNLLLSDILARTIRFLAYVSNIYSYCLRYYKHCYDTFR